MYYIYDLLCCQSLDGKMVEGERRMGTERCARLCAVAIANQLEEAWIALQPVLIAVYGNQYMPSVFSW